MKSGRMALHGLALRYPRAAIVLMLAFVIGGLVAYRVTPRKEDPDVLFNGFLVSVTVPGASPAKIEIVAVKPLMERLNGLEGLSHADGTILRDGAQIICHLEGSVDVKAAIDEGRKIVADVARILPPEVEPPLVTEFSTAETPILVYGVSAQAGEGDLNVVAEKLRDVLEAVSGVKRVTLDGQRERQLLVRLNQDRLNQYRIDLLALMQALAERNQSVPGGDMRLGRTQFSVETSNELSTIEDVRKTIVAFADGRSPVKISDLAEDVRPAYAKADHLVRVDGEAGVSLSVYRKGGADLFDVTRAVEARLESLRSVLPPGLKIRRIVVQQESVARIIQTFESNLLAGSLLVALIIFLHMGFRVSLVVCAAIPLSVLSAFAILAFMGVEYHKVSVFSLVLVLGMLVDNAIVMVENIFRVSREAHLPREEALEEAARQVAGPLVSSTLTTIAAFLPLFLMSGQTGLFIADIPRVVTVALLCSLGTALVFTPLLCHWILPRNLGRSLYAMASGDGATGGRGGRRGSVRGPFEEAYARLMKGVLRYKYPTLLLWGLLFLCALEIIPSLGLQLFPAAERRELVVDVVAPARCGIQATSRIVHEVEERIRPMKHVRHVLTSVGRNVPRFHYAVGPRRQLNFGQMIVVVDEGKNMNEVMGAIRVMAEGLAEAKVSVQSIVEGTYVGKAVAVYVCGADRRECSRVAERIEGYMRSMGGCIDVGRDRNDPVPRLVVELDHDRCSSLGLSGELVSRVVRAVVSGATIGRVPDGSGQERDLVVQVLGGTGVGLDRLRNLRFLTAGGGQVPLSHLATLRNEPEDSVRHRRNLEATIKVGCNVQGVAAETVSRELRRRLRGAVPPDITLEFAGETEERDRSFSSLLRALIWAMCLIFFILVAQFDSFLQPLVVLAALPLAIIGAVAGLFLTGYPFGFMAFLGIVALSGIVVNDAILLIDAINGLRAGGMEGREAIVEAGILRHRPIYLTTVTTVSGVLPLALFGGALWAPLAWVISFGIAMATLLTLVVIPTGYAVVERL